MGVNIKVSSLEQKGETPFEVFSRMLFIAKTITDHLISLKSGFVVNDPVSFMLKLGNNMLTVAETFQRIVILKRDSNSAYALFRIQADYLATLLLIFESKSEEETKFRYLLYLIDGLTQRVDSLKEKPDYNGSISTQDYEALINQMTEAEDNAKEVLDYCLKEVEKLSYKTINPTLFGKILKNRQWRYKEFTDASSKTDSFSWKDLYSLIDAREDISSFISLCSHFVHGLVNSLLSDNKEENFEPIVSFNACLIDRYVKMLKSLFGKEKINDILKFYLLGITIKVCD